MPLSLQLNVNVGHAFHILALKINFQNNISFSFHLKICILLCQPVTSNSNKTFVVLSCFSWVCPNRLYIWANPGKATMETMNKTMWFPYCCSHLSNMGPTQVCCLGNLCLGDCRTKLCRQVLFSHAKLFPSRTGNSEKIF